MLKRIARRAVLPALMLATMALGGCYYPGYYGYPGYGYGYGGYGAAYPAYAAPPLVGGVVIGGGGGYYRGRYWR